MGLAHCGLAAGPAFAFARINTISSETLSTSPLRVRTTFTVEFVGYNPGAAYWAIRITTGTGPAVHFYDCVAPAAWGCGSGSTEFVEFSPVTPTWPWPPMTLSIVTDQAAPCVDFDFYNGILGKTPQVNEDYFVQGCLVVDAPTPAGATSWGRLKVTYR
jgi:hypothetical protein